MRIKLVSLALLVIGPILAIGGFMEMSEADRIAKEGVTVPGVIEGGEVRTRKGTKSFTFEVSYVTQEGRKVSHSFSVAGTFARAHATEDAITNDAVEVRYLPEDPQIAALIGNDKNPVGQIIGGASRT